MGREDEIRQRQKESKMKTGGEGGEETRKVRTGEQSKRRREKTREERGN